MRSLLCVLLLACPMLAQDISEQSPEKNGEFFVDGIAHHYATGADCTVVVAAHSALNGKFLAVKVRVYNQGQHSITVRPEDIVVEDAVAARNLMPISGSELARRMRKPYNMARYAVNGVAGASPENALTVDMLNPQLLEMMRAMTAHGNAGVPASGRNALYTDTPGALDEGARSAGPVECDQVCHLRNREAQASDPLAQLQRQSSPDSVEDAAFRANTISPRASVGGVLYYPLSKTSETVIGPHGKKGRLLRVSVPVGGERFQFELPVE
jgi:hypothetical protein